MVLPLALSGAIAFVERQKSHPTPLDVRRGARLISFLSSSIEKTFSGRRFEGGGRKAGRPASLRLGLDSSFPSFPSRLDSSFPLPSLFLPLLLLHAGDRENDIFGRPSKDGRRTQKSFHQRAAGEEASLLGGWWRRRRRGLACYTRGP
ncbi:MAG: hypothetical protein WC483_00315 [Candidatus Paceibacterota bacterium]